MGENQVKTVEYVNTGEVQSAGPEKILYSGAIGSCIVLVGYDTIHRIGAMAHAMLPGCAPDKTNVFHNRFMRNAILELLNQLQKSGSKLQDLRFCYLGGANVLKRPNDSICKENIESIESLIKEFNLIALAKSTGGTKRRTAQFNIEEGCVYFTLGDSKQKLLCNLL